MKALHKMSLRPLVLLIGIFLCLVALGWLFFLRGIWPFSARGLPDPLAERHPQWSPRGDYIASECAFDVSNWEYYDYELCITSPDLPGLTRLKQHIETNFSLDPAWSPSGNAVAFSSPQGLAITTVPSGDVKIIAPECISPAWSPDGQRIACSLEGNITMINITTATSTTLTTSGHDYNPQWEHDGQTIFFIRNAQIHDYALYELRLASKTADLVVSDVGAFALSPNDIYIAYPKYEPINLAVLQLQTGTSESILTAFSTCLEGIARPQWSYDGKSIAFLGKLKRSSDVYLLIVDVITKQVFQLTAIQSADINGISVPSWSPDDSKIVLSVGERNGGRGSHIVIIPTSTMDSSPVECH